MRDEKGYDIIGYEEKKALIKGKRGVWWYILFEIVSSLLKYIFITVIYLFIFTIIRMIYLDIRITSPGRYHGKSGMPYLKLVNRRDELDFKVEESYMLTERLTVGRARGNGIMVADPFLSGKHVAFTYRDGICTIEDLNSTNGTFVNGEKLSETPVGLKDGDRIHVGQLDFLYVPGRRDEG
ncbi:MAG TPA: FHA domain-containing protein [Clostridia bacterium]|nr:FHA domain-containing protein [Clostridia bacterium]